MVFKYAEERQKHVFKTFVGILHNTRSLAVSTFTYAPSFLLGVTRFQLKDVDVMTTNFIIMNCQFYNQLFRMAFRGNLSKSQ